MGHLILHNLKYFTSSNTTQVWRLLQLCFSIAFRFQAIGVHFAVAFSLHCRGLSCQRLRQPDSVLHRKKLGLVGSEGKGLFLLMLLAELSSTGDTRGQPAPGPLRCQQWLSVL